MNLVLLQNIIGGQAAKSVCDHYTSLNEIATTPMEVLMRLPHVGAYKATQLKSALSLAQDLTREVIGDSPLLDSPDKIANYLREEYRAETTEKFVVLCLNTRRRLIKSYTVATGTLDTLLVHSRECFRNAILCNAAAICVSHCHPSGCVTPSEADAKVTRDLIRAGQLLKIEVVDHVIMGRASVEQPKDYASLRELGYFYS